MKRIRGKEKELQREWSIMEPAYAEFFILCCVLYFYYTLAPLNSDQPPALLQKKHCFTMIS